MKEKGLSLRILHKKKVKMIARGLTMYITQS